MKQIAVSLLLCLAAVASVHAQATGTVYSLNIVGFQKITVSSNDSYALAAVPFVSDDPNINSVIGDQLTGGDSFDNSDDLLKWDASTQSYKNYFLLGDVGDTNYNFKWIDSSTGEVATDADLLASEGFWLRNRQSTTQTVVVVGDVVSASTVTNQIVPGYQLVAYPFSSEILINDASFTNGATGGDSFDNSDNIVKWNPDTQSYQNFFLLGNIGDPQYNWKWIDNSTGEVAGNTYLKPGEGFWYRHRGSGFNWVENRPYTFE